MGFRSDDSAVHQVRQKVQHVSLLSRIALGNTTSSQEMSALMKLKSFDSSSSLIHVCGLEKLLSSSLMHYYRADLRFFWCFSGGFFSILISDYSRIVSLCVDQTKCNITRMGFNVNNV